MITVIVHIFNDDPVVCEIDQIPAPTDALLIAQNPRLRDGKTLSYLERDVSKVIWPIHRINFIEIVSSEGEEDIITFVRE